MSFDCSPLHPLSELQYQKCCSMKEKTFHLFISGCVQWRGKVYASLLKQELDQEGKYIFTPKILVLSSDFSSLTLITTVPVMDSSLSTYNSKLVMAGGREIAAPHGPTNNLFSSDNGENWKPLIPPMPTKRFLPAVYNTGGPEYLVVAGGTRVVGSSSLSTDVVEVLKEGAWFTLRPLPLKFVYISHTLHNGSVFIGGKKDGYNPQLQVMEDVCTYCCPNVHTSA